MSLPFSFKQFTVHQDRCAMKIGTDGVLLGAWTPVDASVNSILDIGTGTGVIALMMAQRGNAEIVDALEIDADAYEQAVDNFEASPWGDRLFCYHASYQEFVEEIDDQYDLLISNPPFYAEDYKTADQKRDLARFQDALPFEHILIGATKLLTDLGQLAIIVPVNEEQKLVHLGERVGLYPQKITRVRGTLTSEVKRSMLLFGKKRGEVKTDELVIEISRHQYTKEYISLTQDFYLNM
ncbi:methyltransferase [Aquimarina sp. D1M17]|uniref:tRNA1(Val) (adenine(37)-N6)-methyltransferase n=1 Tax=Aquimarina acroporae TaxID=2937283 RepID=UPI0020BF0934|nr:methyltransferase [Aquimarina acroporae]MCK8521095.1 methyltransferase [Aquimarina acroporae]